MRTAKTHWKPGGKATASDTSSPGEKQGPQVRKTLDAGPRWAPKLIPKRTSGSPGARLQQAVSLPRVCLKWQCTLESLCSGLRFKCRLISPWFWLGNQQLGGPGAPGPGRRMSPPQEEKQFEGVTHPAQLSAVPVVDPGPAEPQSLVWGPSPPRPHGTLEH